jgi:hypothetical protein
MELVAGLAACALGIEVCGSVLIEGVTYAHRPYPSVAWEVAVDRMHTGDIVVTCASVFCSSTIALVVRDASNVIYAVTARSGIQPMAWWLRRQTRAGAQCCWRPLCATDRPRGLLHRRITSALRPRDEAFQTLLKAGILASNTALELLNCNTAPGYRFDASLSLLAPQQDLDKADC